MEAKEIREMAINSSQAYYNYLLENDKGIEEVELYSISSIDEKKETFKLKLSRKLFDLDAIFFRFMDSKENYDTSVIKVVQYDSHQNNLIVRPNKELVDRFRYLSRGDMILISDLRFLVERIKKWFEKNGSGLKLPTMLSSLRSSWEDIAYFPDRKPSTNQLKALKTIFSTPFSYIWGAPGTGKTQIVLSYALLHYVKSKKKVAIFGPTNNAIEQVLRGVIEMTDRAGIEREQILRIGNPSKKFAEKYPEICETKGLEKQLKEIDRQINVIKDIISYQDQIEALNKTKESLPLFEELARVIEKFKPAVEAQGQKLESLKKMEQSLLFMQKKTKSLEGKLIQLELKSKSLLHTVTKFFSSGNSKVENEILKCKKEIEGTRKWKEQFLENAVQLKTELEGLVNTVKGYKENSNELLQMISRLNQTPETKKIISDLDLDNFQSVWEKLDNYVTEQADKLTITESLAKDYSQMPQQVLTDQITVLKKEREAIAAQSTEERLKNVYIVACTLDTYVGRFPEHKLAVDHIFLDEASYANVIKALTLFHHNVPITFLGDHKQLPPVCELNDLDITKNKDYRDVFIWSQSAIFLEGLFNKQKDECLQDYLKNKQLTAKAMVKADINETFRFGSNLAQVLEQHVYQNGFRSVNKAGNTTIYFIDAVMTGFPARRRENRAEAIAIQHLVAQLDTEDFAILTPYRNQLKLIGSLLPQARNDQKILTVHGSQGREWHTVILSVSDSNKMWFTDSHNYLSKGLNLMNTAVSRAKKRLIIVCNHGFWQSQTDQLICGLLQEATPFTSTAPII